jgi:endogenous inhibitor of DNA gyrase (YacG/DUF329 family)
VIKICKRCGKEFETTKNAQKFCCAACRDADLYTRNQAYQERYKEKRKAMRAAKTKMSKDLIALSCAAHAEHLSYGYYVAKYKL